MKTQKPLFFVEMTDTCGGEANYCWVNRFIVRASSERGAIGMVTRKTGYRARASYAGRYDVRGAAVCYFVEWIDEETAKTYCENYSHVEVLS